MSFWEKENLDTHDLDLNYSSPECCGMSCINCDYSFKTEIDKMYGTITIHDGPLYCPAIVPFDDYLEEEGI